MSPLPEPAPKPASAGPLPGPGFARRFELRSLVPDAARLLRSPAEFFAALEPEGPWWPPMRTVLAWGLAAGLIDLALTVGGLRPGGADWLERALPLFIAPALLLAVSFPLAGLYHLLCLLLGGSGSWRTSFRVIASASPLLTLDIAVGPVVPLRLCLILYKYFVAGIAAEGLHRVPRRRARIAFGLLAAVSVLVNALTWAGL